MSDLIRREDAARIAEDYNLDIWEYSTGNRSRIGHDPVAEAIRALPAVQPHVNETPKSEHDIANMLTLTAERDRLAAAVDAVMADRKRIIEERDRGFVMVMERAEKAEAEVARLTELLPHPGETAAGVMWRNFQRGVRLEELAKTAGVTRERARQMVRKAEMRMGGGDKHPVMVRLVFSNADATPKTTVLDVSAEAVPDIMAWYGAYCAGDRYTVTVDGRNVPMDQNGEPAHVNETPKSEHDERVMLTPATKGKRND